MADDGSKPVVVATVGSELIATMMVGRLESEGILAQVAGGLTAGWRAEAPGKVVVMVLKRDEARAKELLAQWERERAERRGEDEDEGMQENVER